uniref:Chaoptin n=1 Tax=Acrobeloides nanus TaxID=290746 RepID=A0A914CE65_9BILA
MLSTYLGIFYAIGLSYRFGYANAGEPPLKCPRMCTCQGLISIKCSKLTSADLEILFNLLGDHRYTELLQNLSITYSTLKDLTQFPPFNQLIYLDLSNNEIIHTDTPKPFSLSSVVFLDLRYNSFNSINRDSFLMFPNVEEVRLEHNKIFSIDWEAFRLFKLRKLYISNNYLPTVSEHMLRFTPNLEVLDLSHNQLTAAQSSSFFSAQRLSFLDLSHNRMQRFDYDSFSPLYQLETLDLSFNNFSTIPGGDLRQMIGLRVLNFSGNPFEKITAGDFVQPALQVLDVSYCPKLRLIESRAFLKLPNLHTVNLSNNPSLVFISPNAFENNSLIFEYV